ncbi:Hypothetical protein PHPALM_11537 [Phytophthora palmivora]|uniref:Uncharacterized protein n=1 Tax=Phytophthora palmivora TaxID=4796 RepID=A0A2P4Y205_9STRA|nr:Hypothetical protein PHPALM_11537 [Phytophthora palmivora]
MVAKEIQLGLPFVITLPSYIWELIRAHIAIGNITCGSIHGHVEVPSLSRARNGLNFFHFNVTYAGGKRAGRVVRWGHQDLIRLFTYADCTVYRRRSTGASFSRFTTEVPVVTYPASCLALHASQHMITCDFEPAFINAVGDQFPESTVRLGSLRSVKVYVNMEKHCSICPTNYDNHNMRYKFCGVFKPIITTFKNKESMQCILGLRVADHLHV